MPASKLSRYNSKRDFAQTAEPPGRSPADRAEQHRFVIQKHAARRLHYDLRLELGGVFKSWAVTRGPSLDPADKRLAVEVEDHPLAYGDFEGTIPAGQYGGGTVQLWDRGYWRPESGESPANSLKAGELKFTLEGKRLHGSWVLVRMRHDRNGGKRTNWLLIKHRDQDNGGARATARLMAEDRSVASGRSMAQITAGKAPAPTPFMASAAKVKRVARAAGIKPQRFPAFIGPQLCQLQKTPPAGDSWVHEAKLDGYRVQLRVAQGKVTLKTRKGLDWTDKFRAIATAAAGLPDCIVDGELTVLDRKQNPSFSELQSALAEGHGEKLVYFAFDLLWASGRDLRSRALLERKELLKELLDALPAAGPIRYVDHVTGNGAQVLASACKLGLEGLVSKRVDAPYISERTRSWIKTKCRAGQEIIIGGWTGDANHLRSLLGGVMRDGKLAYVGRIGTGYNASNSRQLLPRLKALTRARNPFTAPPVPRQESNVHWLKPELVAEVEFAGWTGDRMLRQAAYKGLRADKPAREVKTEVPDSDPAPGVPARNPPGALTNPQKVLWPATRGAPALTKQDLAEYYAAMSGWILEHIKGRPCSLIRAPDGITGPHFFQRHAMDGQSTPLELVKVRGDRKAYLEINTPEALLAVAQLAGVELHPWNCAPGAPERPGRLVFDLDPAPGVGFSKVIAAALELRERLRKVGLESLCKTTGGKGLHVVVPRLAEARKSAQPSWASAKLFAQTICAQMAADHPRLYLITASKAARAGRIFLDYLRNDRTATAVAPLSPRARPGAPVSMPLNWSQLRTQLDQSVYTLRTAPARLAKARPWADYQQISGSLDDAARKLLSGKV
jgi:bifunctional non-homologous end joining protein LigD